MLLVNLRVLPEDVLLSIFNKLTPTSYSRLRRTSRFADEFAEANRDLLNITVYNSSLMFVEPKLMALDCEVRICSGISTGKDYHIQYKVPLDDYYVDKTIKAISGFRFEYVHCTNNLAMSNFNQNFCLLKKIICRSKCDTLNVDNITANQLEALARNLRPKRLCIRWNADKGRLPRSVLNYNDIDLRLHSASENVSYRVVDLRSCLKNREKCRISFDCESTPIFTENIVLNAIQDWQEGRSDISFLKVKHRRTFGYFGFIGNSISGPKRLIPFWNGQKVNLGPKFETEAKMDPYETSFDCGRKTPIAINSWLLPSFSSSGEERWGLLTIKTVPNDEKGNVVTVMLSSLSSPGCPLDTSVLAGKLPYFFVNCPPVDLSTLRCQLNFCTPQEMGTQFSIFYADLHNRQPFRFSEEPFPGQSEKPKRTLKIHKLPEQILLAVVQKMTGTSFVRLRRTCSQMDVFAEHNRKFIRISAVQDTYLTLISDIQLNFNPDLEQLQSHKCEIGIRSGGAVGDYSYRQPMTKEIVPWVKEAISGFHFKTIIVNHDNMDEEQEPELFDEAFELFFDIISPLRCHFLLTWDLSAQQMNRLGETLRPTFMSVASEFNFVHLNEITYLWKSEEISVDQLDAHGEGPEVDVFSLGMGKTHCDLKIRDKVASTAFKDNISRLLKSWQNGTSRLNYFRLKYLDTAQIYDSLDNWKVGSCLEDLVPLFDGRRVNLGANFVTEDLEPFDTIYRFGEDTPFKVRAWLLPRLTSSGRQEWAWLSVKATLWNDESDVTVLLQNLSTPEASLELALLIDRVPYLVINCPPLSFDSLRDQLDSSAPEGMGAAIVSFIDYMKAPPSPLVPEPVVAEPIEEAIDQLMKEPLEPEKIPFHQQIIAWLRRICLYIIS